MSENSHKCYKCRKPGHFARECKETSTHNSEYRDDFLDYNRGSESSNARASNYRSENSKASSSGRYNRNYPRNENSGSQNNRCYRCNKIGHLARDCKETAERCYRCNQAGHHAKDCTNEVESGSCYNCGQVGHLQRNCPKGSSKQCYKCKETGHLARDCPENQSDDDRTCYNCGKPGHISRDCPESGLNLVKDAIRYK